MAPDEQGAHEACGPRRSPTEDGHDPDRELGHRVLLPGRETCVGLGGAFSRPYQGAQSPVPGLALAGSGADSPCFLGHSTPYPRDPRVPPSDVAHGRLRENWGMGDRRRRGRFAPSFRRRRARRFARALLNKSSRSLARGRERSSRQRAWCGAERSTTAFQAIELTPRMTDPAHCAQKRFLHTF